jgi:hypothetical protein
LAYSAACHQPTNATALVQEPRAQSVIDGIGYPEHEIGGTPPIYAEGRIRRRQAYLTKALR